MAKNTSALQRKQISYFDGVNRLVSSNLAKATELSHAENARSVTIGTIEKRAGTRRLGDEITATANYKIFFFDNETTPGFYRISTVGGVTSIYYLNSSASWTALTGFGTSIYELGDSTTQFDISRPSGNTSRYTWDTNGTDPNIDSRIRVGTTVVIAAQNFSAVNNGTFTVTGVSTNYFDVTNASGTAESNKTIGTGSIVVTGNKFSSVTAENCNFLVNGDTDNMYIGADGTTVTTSASTSGHLYLSPKARKINYYKGKLHIADYTVGDTRYKNSVMISSEPLGIVSLVNLDYANTDCAADDWIEVTDTKYIYTTDTLDIYRGNVKVADITVKDKTESKIQINAITFSGSFTTLEASDEIWVDGTYNGTRIFRWAGNPASGTTVKQYDTFTLSGGQNDRITMFTNINDYEIIANSSNMTYWNGNSLKNLDIGIGCIADNGYIKAAGAIWFMHYTGIYITSGYEIPKLISAPVQQIFDGASKSGLEAGAMGKKGTSIFCSIGDVTLYNPDGSIDKVLSDVVLERNLRQENWYIHTGIALSEFCTYDKDDGVDRLEYASTSSSYPIMEFLNGETDDNTSAKKEILFRIDTNDITLSDNFEKISYPQSVIIETERGSSLDVFISLDGAPFYQLQGKADKGCSIIKINGKSNDDASPPRCRRLKISVRDFSKSLCKISRLAILYAESLEEENQRH
jgi:hypothetical protein